MAAYRRVYDSRHLQADCQEPGSAPEPYAQLSSTGYLYLFIITPPPSRGAEYCDERVCRSVCVFVCPRAYLPNYTSNLYQIFVHVIYGSGSVLLWRRSDTFSTSGFMDDVIFSHKPRLLDVAAQLKRSAHAALGLVISCAQ